MRHAAIDIGTNSFHLVVAEADDKGGFDIVTTEKEMVRLGHGGTDMNELSDDAIDRGVASLQRMAAVAESLGADLSAVATSAVREASNRKKFLKRAKKEAGVSVEVISGVEEARLIHLGVLQALDVYDEKILVVDIGGGSTEFVVGEGIEIFQARSMKLGAIRLTDRFLRHENSQGKHGKVNTSADAIAQCRRYVRSMLNTPIRELREHGPEMAIGSSGTISTLTAMGGNAPVLTLNSLKEILASFVESTAESRLEMPGLDAKRADIIVAGAALLLEIFLAFGITEMTHSPYALREGVLLDRFGGSSKAGLERLRDLRGENVAKLGRDLDPDFKHAKHSAKLSLDLFDKTASVHELGDHDRQLLKAGAILHNVGLFVSHAAHHKHSYYIVRNTDQLTGFTDNEIEIIAQITRYHRKSHPAETHQPYMNLSEEDQYRVKVLAGILRIAIGLDRSHASSVKSVTAVHGSEGLEITPVIKSGTDIDLEMYAANERSGLLAAAIGCPVTIIP